MRYKSMRCIRKTMLTFITMLCLALQFGSVAHAEKAIGSTLELSKTQGTVSVENMTGKQLPILDHMKLYSGYGVETKESSYAWITLDDTKAVKLDALSKSEIQKSGNDLEVLIEKGNLFFDVEAPLAENETFHIRTSSMTMGIRGTAGWVNEKNRNITEIGLLDGMVTLSALNPDSGMVQTASLQGGQKALIVHQEGITTIHIGAVQVTDVPGSVAVEIKDNAVLEQRLVKKGSYLPLEEMITQAEDRLKADEERINEANQAVIEKIKDLDAASIRNPEWGGEDASKENGSKRYAIPTASETPKESGKKSSSHHSKEEKREETASEPVVDDSQTGNAPTGPAPKPIVTGNGSVQQEPDGYTTVTVPSNSNTNYQYVVQAPTGYKMTYQLNASGVFKGLDDGYTLAFTVVSGATGSIHVQFEPDGTNLPAGEATIDLVQEPPIVDQIPEVTVSATNGGTATKVGDNEYNVTAKAIGVNVEYSYAIDVPSGYGLDSESGGGKIYWNNDMTAFTIIYNRSNNDSFEARYGDRSGQGPQIVMRFHIVIE